MVEIETTTTTTTTTAAATATAANLKTTPAAIMMTAIKNKKRKMPNGNDLISLAVSIVCVVLIVIIVYNLVVHFVTEANQDSDVNRTFTIDHDNNTFLMNGKPFRYVAGSFHYFRAVPNAWHKRLRTMRSAGLNVIDTYVEWSLHNPREGVYVWTGIADIEKFIKVAQKEGFYIILRPGPYTCAGRDNGGLPYWLFRKYPNIQLRTSDANYTQEVAVWYSELMPKIQRFLYGNGGPIIMMQLENKYSSFSACDRDYLNWLRDETLKYVQDKAVLFTSDYPVETIKCGIIDEVFATINFGVNEPYDLDQMWSVLRSVQPTGPLVNSEFYAGWLTHWPGKNQTVDPQSVAAALNSILASNASVNFHTFFGGTNFGFTAGATSYKYDTVMNEAGNITKKLELVREVIGRYFEIPKVKLIKEQTAAYGRVNLKPVMHLLSEEGRAFFGSGEVVQSLKPKTFEDLDQYSGLILYETNLSGLNTGPANLTITELRDRALVYVDQEFVGSLPSQNCNFSITWNNSSGSLLQILVENQGRVIYNSSHDTKGIMGAVTLHTLNGVKVTLDNWSHTVFPLEERYVEKLLKKIPKHAVNNDQNQLLMAGPMIFYGEFWVKAVRHTFLKPSGWGKGVAYVNGFNLGRYWTRVEFQKSLYVPQEILHYGRNTFLLIEYEQTNRINKDVDPYVTLDDKSDLDN